ncbi:WD repeat-containing protein DWA2 [Bienertia sinuspersici]
MQGGSTGIGYGLKYQARCIADVKADTDHTSFIAGTISLKEENEVHLIRLSNGGTELVCEGLFSHPNEIWDLASCPYDQRIFSTVFFNGNSRTIPPCCLAMLRIRMKGMISEAKKVVEEAVQADLEKYKSHLGSLIP